MDPDHDANEDSFADNERGYNGITEPVQIEAIDHTNGPAIILGELRQDGHVISADAKGVLIVESPVTRQGKPDHS